VDNQPDSQLLKGLKCWPVTEIVTYGFDPADAPLDMRGTHLPPADFHKALENPNSVVIDVRNFNESLIGKFAPPTFDGQEKVCMC
jgi:predicted sulfurtransferase